MNNSNLSFDDDDTERVFDRQQINNILNNLRRGDKMMNELTTNVKGTMPSINTNTFMTKMFSRMFRQVDDVVWDMMTGSVGQATNDGIATLIIKEKSEDGLEALKYDVTINLMDGFAMPVPAYAQSIPPEQIQLGDMIYTTSGEKTVGWVVKKDDGVFTIVKKDGSEHKWRAPKVTMLGMEQGVMVLRSLVNMLPGGTSGLGQMQSAMMPMLMMSQMMGDGDNSAISDMMPMMLMSQMGVTQNTTDGVNPMGGMAQMMPQMMMAQMMAKMMGNKGNF